MNTATCFPPTLVFVLLLLPFQRNGEKNTKDHIQKNKRGSGTKVFTIKVNCTQFFIVHDCEWDGKKRIQLSR